MPLVLPARVIVPVWLIRLLEMKLMLPPLAFWAIAPPMLMPVLLPAAALLPVTLM